MSIVCGTSQTRSGVIIERWKSLCPTQWKRGPQGVVPLARSDGSPRPSSKVPELPVVTSVGLRLMVPWQSMHSMAVAARVSPYSSPLPPT